MEYRPIRLSRLEWKEREFIYGASRISLCQEASGEDGREYLFRQRGLDVATVSKFRLGYVPFSIDPYSIRPEYRKSVASFRGRIVFPIFNAYDELIALSVRPIKEVDEQKYWNESFAKGENLYGLNIAKYSMAKWKFVIVVEGQMDVLKMHSHGLTNTVGILGGGFTPIHCRLLWQWTASNVVFIMDGDNAGMKHAEKAAEIMRAYDKAVKKNIKKDGQPNWKTRFPSIFIQMDKGEDPASFLNKNGGQAMRKIVADSMVASKIKVPKKWA